MKKAKMISVRLTAEEWEKIEAIEHAAKTRNRGYAPLSDILRELMGLLPYNLTSELERLSLASDVPPAPERKQTAAAARRSGITFRKN